MHLPHLLAVARGDQPADLVLRNANLVNVYSGRIEMCDIAIYQDRIAGIGAGYRGQQEIDVAGAYVAPGLIDAHVHIESSLCVPAQFASVVLPHGITCVVSDPHEIANVAGADGIRFMLENSQGLPLEVVIMAPSCVPATHMETSGATLNAEELADLLAEGMVHGLAEVMNFPGVIAGADAVLRKLTAFAGRPQDGHAPQVRGKSLNAYAAAGIGSEHECTTVEEALEKLSRGFYILIREATNAHNLHKLLPMITPENSRRICFCTDDRIPSDLIDQGSIDYMVREAIRFGIDPIIAIRMATLNTAEWFGMHQRGGIAPGRVADLVIVDDLQTFQIRQTYARGQLVAQDGKMVVEVRSQESEVRSQRPTVHIDEAKLNFAIPVQGHTMRVIQSIEGQLLTNELHLTPTVEAGLAVADPARDLLKMAVIERHKGSGAIGLGFITGFGLQRGAIAGTVAHDHHNLVVIGADDASMRAAVRTLKEMQGGLVVMEGEQRLAALPLPVAGLMSDRPVAEVRQGYDQLIAAARQLGSPLHDPFMAMSFMALEVIPSLKLTDQGLVDVGQFQVVPLF